MEIDFKVLKKLSVAFFTGWKWSLENAYSPADYEAFLNEVEESLNFEVARLMGLGVGLSEIERIMREAEREVWLGRRDDDGQVHYSDTPLDNKSKKFEYKSKVIGQENFKNNDEAPNRSKEKSKPNPAGSSEIDKRNQQRAIYDEEQKAQRKVYCAEAKQDLRATQEANLLFKHDEKGERYFLNKQQRKEAIEEKKKIVKKWCS